MSDLLKQAAEPQQDSTLEQLANEIYTLYFASLDLYQQRKLRLLLHRLLLPTIPPNPSGLCMCGCGQRTKIAEFSCKKDGWVKGYPVRYIQHHHRRSSPLEYKVEDRGYKTPCWIWQRGKGGPRQRLEGSDFGYGTIVWNRQRIPAHQFYYERVKGPVPEGLELDHLCRIPACVNPDHLEAVTHQENLQRGVNARLTKVEVIAIKQMRSEGAPYPAIGLAFGMCTSHIRKICEGLSWEGIGEKPPAFKAIAARKLTEAQVRQIRALYAQGKPKSEIARQFGVVASNIAFICSRQTWKHVD